MVLRDVMGLEWGMFALVPGVAKAQRYTGRHNFVFFVVRGRARLTFGARYHVPYRSLPLSPGFSADMPRGNYFCIPTPAPRRPSPFFSPRPRGLWRMEGRAAGWREQLAGMAERTADRSRKERACRATWSK
jgi:hypothetical protein